mmetsp:Transcript_41421/g.163113  ORF Transcript_41421/g.163113 Transcript_41421/m.163113 type:complete len:514 (-) Transcript_41421:791-2332(-)
MGKRDVSGGMKVGDVLRNADLGLDKDVSDDRKLRGKLKALKKETISAAERTAHLSQLTLTERTGFLETESPLERTFKVTQEQILEGSDTATKNRGSFKLELGNTGLGPYGAQYSRSGKLLLVYSRSGHVSVTNWTKLQQLSEIYLNQTVRDGTFLHNDSYFALAQRKYVGIYDSSGIELHVLRKHSNPIGLEFLPYHFLLASLGERGGLQYTDTSTGEVVAELKTSYIGGASSISLNPFNACIATGHSNGTVALWSPISSEPLVRILANRGSINSIAITQDGTYMLTSGSDACCNIYDLRTYKKLNCIRLPVAANRSIFSQRNLLALSFGPNVKIYKDIFSESTIGAPYMENLYAGRVVESLSFCPYEDVLGVSHSKGFCNMIVPGAGVANFDSSLPNPFETSKQRRQREVRSLMEKLQPETISLDPTSIGGIDKDPAERLKDIQLKKREAERAQRAKSLQKKRTRGRNKIAKKLKRKQQNVVDEKSERYAAKGMARLGSPGTLLLPRLPVVS